MAVFTGNGAVGSPSFTFSADTDTGVFRPAGNNLGFQTAGAEVARYDSTGRYLQGTGGGVRTVVSLVPNWQLEGTSINGGSACIVSNLDATSGAFLALCKTRGTALGSSAAAQNNDQIAQIRFGAADGTSVVQSVQISAHVDGAVGAGIMPGRLQFATAPAGSSTPATVMTITSDKYVRLATGSSGIQFNGTTSNLDALDDYDEGSFTWTFVKAADNSDASIGISALGTNGGRYTKIGNVVTITGYVSFTGGDANPYAAGDFIILSGLPFVFTPASRPKGTGILISNANTGNVGLWQVAGVSDTNIYIQCIDPFSLHSTTNPIQFQIQGIV